MKVFVDREKCIGSGQCVFASPEVFTLDEDGIVALLTDAPDPELASAVHEAASNCPAMVIRVEP